MYKKILFPIDVNSKLAWDKSIPMVIDLVKKYESELYIMTVIPNYGATLVEQYFPKGWVEEIIEKVKGDLLDVVKKYFPNDMNIQYIVERGSIYKSIVEQAEELNADLIVMAAHRPELKDYLLGPNAAKVARHATTSVLIVREY